MVSLFHKTIDFLARESNSCSVHVAAESNVGEVITVVDVACTGLSQRCWCHGNILPPFLFSPCFLSFNVLSWSGVIYQRQTGDGRLASKTVLSCVFPCVRIDIKWYEILFTNVFEVSGRPVFFHLTDLHKDFPSEFFHRLSSGHRDVIFLSSYPNALSLCAL